MTTRGGENNGTCGHAMTPSLWFPCQNKMLKQWTLVDYTSTSDLRSESPFGFCYIEVPLLCSLILVSTATVYDAWSSGWTKKKATRFQKRQNANVAISLKKGCHHFCTFMTSCQPRSLYTEIAICEPSFQQFKSVEAIAILKWPPVSWPLFIVPLNAVTYWTWCDMGSLRCVT